jgi:hypothetical protein
MISLSEINIRLKKIDEKIKKSKLSQKDRSRLKKERMWLKELGLLMKENRNENIDNYYYTLFFDFKIGKYNEDDFDSLINKLAEKTLKSGFCPISDHLKDQTYKLLKLDGV